MNLGEVLAVRRREDRPRRGLDITPRGDDLGPRAIDRIAVHLPFSNYDLPLTAVPMRLVLKAYRRVHHSSLGLSVLKKKIPAVWGVGFRA